MGLIIRMSLISDGLQCKCALTIDIYIGTGRTYIVCGGFCSGVCLVREKHWLFFK